jgi:hypothetical protein
VRYEKEDVRDDWSTKGGDLHGEMGIWPSWFEESAQIGKGIPVGGSEFVPSGSESKRRFNRNLHMYKSCVWRVRRRWRVGQGVRQRL